MSLFLGHISFDDIGLYAAFIAAFYDKTAEVHKNGDNIIIIFEIFI